MKIKPILPSEEIAMFRESGGQDISIKELEMTLDNLNLADIDNTMQAVKRCNDRCKGNKVRFEVEDPRINEKLTFAVRLSEK